MILILITSLSILTLVFSAFFLKDLINYKEDFETQTSYLVPRLLVSLRIFLIRWVSGVSHLLQRC